MGNIIQVNGHTYDHTSLKLGFLNSTIIKELVKGVNWSHGFTVGESYGTSSVPLPTPQGRYKAELSLDVYLEAWEQLLSSGALGDGYLAMDPFTVTLTYKARGSRPHKIEAKECRILKAGGGSSSDQQGNVVIKLEMYTRIIFENGRSPVPLLID